MGYITFRNFGSSGDLGSQIMTYAALYAISKETGKKIVFRESEAYTRWGVKVGNLFNLDYETKPDHFFQDFVTIHHNIAIPTDPIVFALDPDTNYEFVNLFPTYHYFDENHKESIDKWSWRANVEEKAKQLYDSVKQEGKEMVSIHVRRGDYLSHDHFCKLDQRYYGQALEYFIPNIEKYHFLVFSNDIDWCKDNLISGEMVTFMDCGTDYVDLAAMSMCDHNIIANSTFSWWAAYLNKNVNKVVICPTNYVKSYSEFSFLNTRYYLPQWKNIDNETI